MSEKTFAASVLAMFLLSFIGFSAYLSYEVKHSKVALYKARNKSHSYKVRARIVNSYEGIAELNKMRTEESNTKALMLPNYKVLAQENQLLASAQIEDLLSIAASNSVLISSEPEIAESAVQNIVKIQPSAINLFVEKNRDELAQPKIDYVNDKALYWYLGGGIAAVVGVKNYFNTENTFDYTTQHFADHKKTEVLYEQQQLVKGFNVSAFAGVQLSNNISLELGVGYQEITGASKYAVEHSYIKEFQRLEWVVTGEDDAKAVSISDYVETVSNDTITGNFNRQMVIVPLNVNYAVQVGKFKPFVSVGANLNLTASGSNTKYSSMQDLVATYSESTGLNQISATIGLGADYDINSNLSLRIKPSYEVGLWNRNPSYFKGNVQNLSLQTGLIYKL